MCRRFFPLYHIDLNCALRYMYGKLPMAKGYSVAILLKWKIGTMLYSVFIPVSIGSIKLNTGSFLIFEDFCFFVTGGRGVLWVCTFMPVKNSFKILLVYRYYNLIFKGKFHISFFRFSSIVHWQTVPTVQTAILYTLYSAADLSCPVVPWGAFIL
jgi:hypothetical protein